MVNAFPCLQDKLLHEDSVSSHLQSPKELYTLSSMWKEGAMEVTGAGRCNFTISSNWRQQTRLDMAYLVHMLSQSLSSISQGTKPVLHARYFKRR